MTGRQSGSANQPSRDVPPLVSVGQKPSPLVQRARSFLESGPAGSVPLIEHVCNLPGAPAAVAEQMALALFSGASDFSRGADGQWNLVRERPLTARVLREDVGRSLDALTYVVVDVETTGGSPGGGDRITEFCAVTVAHGEVLDVFETLVNPQRPIPPAITRLTRI